MLFSGYETIDAIITLQNEEEQIKMFQFVTTMKDIIENREEMFGIFSKMPEKVMVLPGLKTVFNKFINSVIQFKNLSLIPNSR